MPKTESISVVIPCYNYGHFLPDAVGSVLAQTLRPDEIIVVDDGSTDNTAEVCKQFDRVRYLWKPNGGLSSARNFGIAHSTGGLLMFLDADDLLSPTALATLWRAWQQAGDGLGALFGRTEVVHGPEAEAGGDVPEFFPDPDEVAAYADRHVSSDTIVLSRRFLRRLIRSSIFIASCTLIARSTFETVGLFDESLATIEDQDMWLRIAGRLRLGFVNQTVCYYRRHGGNITDSSNWVRNRRNILRVQAKVAHARWAGPKLRLMARRQYANTADLLAQRLTDQDERSQARRALWDSLRHDPFRLKTWLRLVACGLGGRKTSAE